jgi:hypothetical protein
VNVVILPDDAGVVIDFTNTSESVIPTKFADASVLYPHVLTASALGDPLADVGIVVPRLSILVLDSDRTYSLNPLTSVEVTVTVLVPVPNTPTAVGVIVGIVTLPEVAIEREVSSP